MKQGISPATGPSAERGESRARATVSAVDLSFSPREAAGAAARLNLTVGSESENPTVRTGKPRSASTSCSPRRLSPRGASGEIVPETSAGPWRRPCVRSSAMKGSRPAVAAASITVSTKETGVFGPGTKGSRPEAGRSPRTRNPSTAIPSSSRTSRSAQSPAAF